MSQTVTDWRRWWLVPLLLGFVAFMIFLIPSMFLATAFGREAAIVQMAMRPGSILYGIGMILSIIWLVAGLLIDVVNAAIRAKNAALVIAMQECDIR